jgi:hypothetical protein
MKAVTTGIVVSLLSTAAAIRRRATRFDLVLQWVIALSERPHHQRRLAGTQRHLQASAETALNIRDRRARIVSGEGTVESRGLLQCMAADLESEGGSSWETAICPPRRRRSPARQAAKAQSAERTSFTFRYARGAH